MKDDGLFERVALPLFAGMMICGLGLAFLGFGIAVFRWGTGL